MRFSLILPTFKRPHTLPRAIGSVLSQTYPDWQLIVVDNAGDVVAVPDDPRIHLVRATERPSAAYARNEGLKHATGDAVAFLDDDDVLTPSALAIFDHLFRAHPAAKLVRAGLVLPNGEVHFGWATPTAAVRREFATATWHDRSYFQDQDYWSGIVTENGWTEASGDVVAFDRVVCVALHDPKGGLRAGNL